MSWPGAVALVLALGIAAAVVILALRVSPTEEIAAAAVLGTLAGAVGTYLGATVHTRRDERDEHRPRELR